MQHFSGGVGGGNYPQHNNHPYMTANGGSSCASSGPVYSCIQKKRQRSKGSPPSAVRDKASSRSYIPVEALGGPDAVMVLPPMTQQQQQQENLREVEEGTETEDGGSEEGDLTPQQPEFKSLVVEDQR